MNEINILLYEQHSRVNLRYYLSETVLNTNLSIDRNSLHTVCVPLLGASSERSQFQPFSNEIYG